MDPSINELPSMKIDLARVNLIGDAEIRRLKELLGQGGFGKVVKAIYSERFYAAKEVPLV